jgi:trimeric autotransporter adhesin
MMSKTRALAMVGLVALLFASGVRIAAEPSSTPRLDWLFNARVAATARVGDTLFVGGGFTNVAPASGILSRFFQLSLTTGEPIPGLPTVNGEVEDITPDGEGGYYIAGAFTNIGGAGTDVRGVPSRTRVAHVLANGSDDTAFRPTFGGQITTVVRVGPSLVVAGDLYIDGGTTVRRLLAVNPVTGALFPWVPPASGFVNRMTAAGDVLFVMAEAAANTRRVTAFDSATGAVLWTSDVVGAASFSGAGALAVAGSRLVVGLDRLYALDLVTGAIDPAWGGPAGASTQVSAVAVSGSTIYVGGSFTTFHGQPRANLAAVDLSNGALLPWAPQASTMIELLVASPAGSVFTFPRLFGSTTSSTVNGESRPSNVVEIGAGGAVTTWRAQASFSPTLLHVSPSGTLVVGTFSVPTTGNVERSALAAFDTTTGAVLPGPTLGANSVGSTFVNSVFGLGSTLYMSGTFDTVNGQPRVNIAAVDVATNTVLPWPATGVSSAYSLVLADGSWIYAYQRSSGGPFGPLRRIQAVTGVLDPVWQGPQTFGSVPAFVVNNGQIMTAGADPRPGSTSAAIGTLDPVTGAFRALIPTAGFGALAVDGDTVYTANFVRDYGSAIGTVRAYDLRTGHPVTVPTVSGQLNDVIVADGRLFVLGGTFTVGGATRVAFSEIQRPGSTTAWDSGFWRLDGGLDVSSRGGRDRTQPGRLSRGGL